MMHKTWSSIEEVPYCFQGHTSNCKATRLYKSSILTQIGRFRTVSPVWNHRWVRNDAQSFKYHKRGGLLFFKFIRQIASSHGSTIIEFDLVWAFPDCHSSLNSLMDLKWYTNLDVVYKTRLIIFRGHPSNFKLTRAKYRRFESNLSKITRPVAAIKSLRFALLSHRSLRDFNEILEK